MSAAMNLRPQVPGAWRRGAVLAFMAAFAAAVIGRAFYMQVINNGYLTDQGNKRQVRTLVLEAGRGAIVDRNHEPLALSAPADSVWAVPDDLLDADPAQLDHIAGLMQIRRSALEQRLRERSDTGFIYLNRQIDPAIAAEYLSDHPPGLFVQREYRRFYPAGEVAAHVVGFCDIDGKGQQGIEAAQESVLRGTPGSRRVIRDRNGKVVEDTVDFVPARQGTDVMLSLDLRLQYLAYRELKAAVEQYKAEGGLIVLADPRNGDILALASQPGYNPNRPEEHASAGLFDRAVSDTFEPGSTIKPLLISQALESHAVSPDIRIDTGPGVFKVGVLTVHDVHPNGVVDLGGLLSKSSNVGAAKIGLGMGAQLVWSGYQRFGVGEAVSAGLPREAPGVLRGAGEWGQIATATASYGYGLTVNALQLVRAYSGIANDGLMPQLSILKRDHLIPSQRVISAATAHAVRLLLEGVVAPGGTAARAAVAGYQVAGKTGTIRKNAKGSYLDGHHQALFVGMLPAEHPRLVGLVMIDDPAGDDYYGGAVSGPVFARVLAAAARLMQIPPDLPTLPAAPTTVADGLPLLPAVSGVRP